MQYCTQVGIRYSIQINHHNQQSTFHTSIMNLYRTRTILLLYCLLGLTPFIEATDMYTKYIAYTRRTSVWGQDDVRIKQVFSPTNFTTIQHAALHLPPLGFGTSLCETPTNSTLLRKEGEENTPHGAGTTRRQLRTDLHSTQGMIPSTSQDGFPTGKGIDHHITTSNLRNSNENGNHRHLWRDGLNLEESSVARDIAIVTLNPTEACSIETQAQNAIEFNRLYSTENGPRIKYLLFTMFCPDPWVGCNLVIPKEDITVILMRPRYLEYLVDAEMPINDDEGKRFLSIDSFSNQTANTTTNSDEDWSFNVTFLPTMPDSLKRKRPMCQSMFEHVTVGLRRSTTRFFALQKH